MQGEEKFQRTGFVAKPVRPAVLLVMFLLWGAAPSLAEGPVRTEPVVVTSTRIEEKVSEQASSVSVVTRKEIEGKGAGFGGDVLQGLPGVDTQRAGSAGNRENIKIRGGKSTQTLVMIDGFPVNSPGTSEFDIGFLTSDLF